MADYLFIVNPKEQSPHQVGLEKSVTWSCSKTAKPGDRAFVYLNGQGVSFEWVIVSAAKPHPDWRFMCRVKLVKAITPPISIQEMRKAIPKSLWAPPHTGMRGYRSVQLPPEAAVRLRAVREAPHITIEALEEEFREAVASCRRRSAAWRNARLAQAPKIPRSIAVTVTSFIRNPEVAAEVLERAAGKCEGCNKAAPFVRASDSSPYLEVHHIVRLADGGEDTVGNAIALCPNCHRKAHYGIATTTDA